MKMDLTVPRYEMPYRGPAGLSVRRWPAVASAVLAAAGILLAGIVWANVLLTPASTTVGPFDNGVRAAATAIVEPATAEAPRGASAAGPTASTASPINQTLIPSDSTVNGFVSGTPTEGSPDVLVPSGSELAGFTSGLALEPSPQTLVPSSSDVDGFSSGLPTLPAFQTLEPTASVVDGTQSGGGAAATSSLSPATVVDDPSPASPMPFANAVRAASSRGEQSSSAEPEASSAERNPFVNGVRGASSACVPPEGKDCVAPPVDLAVTKTCTPDPVRTVHNIECTLTVSNVGAGEALDVQVVDTLPPEAKSFVDVSPGAPTCTESAGVVTCNLGTLAADDGAPGGPDEATVIITFQAPKTGGSGPQDNVTITNCAEVSASNEPPENVGPENQACDDTTVLWKCPDVNGDGVASLGDLALIALHWRHSADPPEDELDQILDLNNDGIVSLGDLAQVAFRWREECPL